MNPIKMACVDQRHHWDETFFRKADFFGVEPSEFARRSLGVFRQYQVQTLLELGCGQGRDTSLFAENGLMVHALDYSQAAIANIRNRITHNGLIAWVSPQVHDLRYSLPFANEFFDACYSHMLLCMEFSTLELSFMINEVYRVLKPGGIAAFSVRSNFDRHFGVGRLMGEGLYEIDGFVVHFFTEGKIRALVVDYEILSLDRFEEGRLPRDLFSVVIKKNPASKKVREFGS